MKTGTVRMSAGGSRLRTRTTFAAALELGRIGWSHRRRRWWSRAPFMPLPSAAHLAWRRETAYGDPAAPAEPGDIVEYAAWRRRQRRAHS